MYKSTVVQDFVDRWLGNVDEKVARDVIDGLRDTITGLQSIPAPSKEAVRKRYTKPKESTHTGKSEKPQGRVCWRCNGEKTVPQFTGTRGRKISVPCRTCGGKGRL